MWAPPDLLLNEWANPLLAAIPAPSIIFMCGGELAFDLQGEPDVMSAEKKQNLQDTFLNSVRKSKTPLTIFLVNGVKLQGVVSWFDNFCVLLRRDGQSQLVYKHAISTIMPAQPVQLYEPGPDQDLD